ncbi:MAG TPA: hypothetical protein VHO69_02570 [Phototrophicaceae bacterium]|nr:hypothetical protein [Phototrophicaceae bacterium]
MSVFVDWDNQDHTVIRLTLQGRWQWAEVRQVLRELGTLLDTVTYPTSVIVHVNQSAWLPGDIKDNVQQITQTIHPYMGEVIIVTPLSIFVELVFQVAALIGGFNFPYRIAPTLEEARRLLSEVPAYAAHFGAAD